MRKHLSISAICLLTVACIPASAQAVNELIPLKAGNYWNLKSAYDATPIRMVVDSVTPIGTKRRAKLTYNNPWSSYTMIVSATDKSVVLEGIETSSYSVLLDNPVDLFSTARAIGSSWNTPLGDATYVSSGATLDTPMGTISGLAYFRLGGQDWYLKPGSGFVQFGLGSTGYKLNATVADPYVIPAPPPMVPAPCPLLGYDISPTSSELNETARMQAAASQGLKFTHLSLRWNDIETSPQVYNLTTIQNWAAFTNTYNFDLAFTIRVVDTSTVWLPSDLAGRSLSDPVVQQRFKQLLSKIVPVMSSRMKWVNLSNEVDLFLSLYPSRTSEVIGFLGQSKTYLKSLRSTLSVGAVISFGTAMNSELLLKSLNPVIDHLAATYYPLRSDFSPRAPGDATGDIQLISALTTKPIILTEVGYPSSTVLGSSPTQQGQFYQNVLQALSKEGSHFVAVNFFQHADMPIATVGTLSVQYSSADTETRYKSLLNSLGMRTFEGAAKPAWNQFKTSLATFSQPNACLRPAN